MYVGILILFQQVLGIQAHRVEGLAQVMAGRRQQTQLTCVIRFRTLPRQIEQSQVKPSTALAMLLQVRANTADQVGAKKKQSLVTQCHASTRDSPSQPQEQPADAPGR